MISSKIKVVSLALPFFVSSLMATNISRYDVETYSLVGVEAGYSTLDYEKDASTSQYRANIGHGGLKLGAETDDFRAFLSGRYYMGESSYDYITTFGAELQYKFNAFEGVNFFIGANGGIANMKFHVENETFSRTISDYYIGGDIGTNIHLSEVLDLEIGSRVISIQAENTKKVESDYITYRIGNMVTGYASLIFKWQMD